jgi:AraC-like DNA-binding protein
MAAPTTAKPENAVYWLDPTLGNLELLRASYVTHAFAPHTHDGYAIGVIEAGAETFTYRRELRVAPAGTIVAINPGELHTGEALNELGWRYRMMYPDVALVQHAAEEMSGRRVGVPFFVEPVIRDPHIAQLLIRLHTALEAHESQLERESRLIWALAQLVMRHANTHIAMSGNAAQKSHHECDIVSRVRQHLAEHMSRNVTLAELTNVANMSAFHLLRTFRDATGLPPHAYHTQLRIAQAKQFLRQGAPIAHVATEVGFTDQSHLNRHFKRVVGVTPGQYVLGVRNFIQDCQARAI